MAQFDIIAASVKAYKTSWAERAYFMKLALAPLLIKICCLVFASAFAGESGTLSFQFFMLPALFAEGWMLSHLTRYIVLGQTWPFRPTGDFEADMDVLAVRARGVLGGTIVYVLIGMALALATVLAQTYLLPYIPADSTASAEPVPASVAVFCIFALAFMFWGFRLVWLYIPFALGSGAGTYLYRLRGLMTSVHMIGLWLICMLPFILILQITLAFAAFAGAALGEAAGYFVMTIFVAAVDTAKAVVVSIGMTFALQDVFTRKEPA